MPAFNELKTGGCQDILIAVINDQGDWPSHRRSLSQHSGADLDRVSDLPQHRICQPEGSQNRPPKQRCSIGSGQVKHSEAADAPAQ